MSGYNTTRKAIFAEMSKYCLDLSKLVVGGVILTAIMDLGVNQGSLILMGLFAVTMFMVIGLLMMYLTVNKNG